ncbi:MAG: hypothetical protein O3B47_03950 [bacterium]|nr:hypothetical protein [bacterium]
MKSQRNKGTSVDFLARVRLFYPFPTKIIQTDNGFEFTWRLQPEITKIHPFPIQCQIYGYEHILIPPAYPRGNFHVERKHRIDVEEVYRGKTSTSLQQLHKINLRNLKCPKCLKLLHGAKMSLKVNGIMTTVSRE